MSPPSDEQLRRLAREILAHDPYARWREGPGLVWRALEAVQRWLGEVAHALWMHVPEGWREALAALWQQLRDALGGLGGHGPPEPWLRVALFVLLGLFVALLAFQLGLALRSVNATSRGPRTRRPGAAPEESLAERARRLAEEGRHLEAAHCAQLAALEILLERRWIELAPCEPNRTLRGRLGGSPLPADLRREFVSLLDRLEEHWFRDRRGGRDLYEAWGRLLARLDALPEAA